MARHRDIRNMDYEDEYDGYDDIYGHSVDDDYYISPSNRQFIYNRETSRDTRFEHEDDIQEVDEIDELSDTDKAKLNSCIDQVKETLGPISVPRSELVNLIMKHRFNSELVVSAILEDPRYHKSGGGSKDKDDTQLSINTLTNSKVFVPSCNNQPTKFNIPKPFSNKSSSNSSSPKSFVIPNIFGCKPAERSANVSKPFSVSSESKLNETKPKNFTIPKLFGTKSDNVMSGSSPKAFNIPNIFASNDSKDRYEASGTKDNFTSLSEVVSSHLKTTLDFDEVDGCVVDDVSNQLSEVHLSEAKSDIFTRIPKNSFDIDLSKALKSTGSLPSFQKNDKEYELEKFEIPFIDGDLMIKKDVKTILIETGIFPCTLDMNHLLKVKCKLTKKPSQLGKAIRRKYRHARANLLAPEVALKYKNPPNHSVKVFLFDTQSPDEYINSHLKALFVAPTVIEPVSTPTVKIVASTATNVVKGFDLPQREGDGVQRVLETSQKPFDISQKLNGAPRSPSPASARGQSPVSGRGTPIMAGSEGEEPRVGRREAKVDPESQYKKERGNGKEHLYMVVIGHVDAGKSTLMGRLLCELGQVNKKTMHKYEQDSKKVGKQSFMYAWVLDETGEERNRGITMDVGRFLFETKSKEVTLLDAPGHKDFIPNMISGAAQADVGLLVVDATRGEFETGFDLGGQTREHALLVRSLGVTQLAVAINKLDTVSWSKERFDEIVQKLRSFLKQAGFKENDVTFVPCSGLTGQNLIKAPTENELLEWYTGPCLIDVIDTFRSPPRPVTKPFRFSVNDVFKGTGSGFCVDGRIETGIVNVGDKILVYPNKDQAVVKSLSIDECPKTVAFAGDQATITLSGIEIQNVSIGNILCDPGNPIPVSNKFEARIVVFNIAVPITKGYSIILHHQSLVEPAVITKLTSQLNKSTGEVQKKHPRFLGKNSSAVVEITVSKPIAMEVYSECKELGRVMLRVGGVTIAAGLITRIFCNL